MEDYEIEVVSNVHGVSLRCYVNGVREYVLCLGDSCGCRSTLSENADDFVDWLRGKYPIISLHEQDGEQK